MSDWKSYSLAELADIRISNVDKKINRGESPVLLCNYMDVYSDGYVTSDIEFMEATATAVEIEKFKVGKGDVLITKDSETPYDIGIPSAVLDDIKGLVCGYHLALIKPHANLVDSVFLSKQLASSEIASYFSRVAAGSTRYGLSNGAIVGAMVRAPVLKKQKKIAKILQTIDRAIEKNQALIEKYQQIKAGLMQDLFTRGIGTDGKLRPPREEAPELYQETPIGWIPKTWDYHELEYLLAPVANNLRSGPFGSALLKSELAADGIPFLGIDNIHIEFFDENFRRFLPEKKFLSLHKYSVRRGDVVITIMGTVGRSAVVPEYIGPALSSKHLWTMTLNTEIVIPELVCWQLNYASWVKAWFRRETQGGIMDAIQSRTLRALRLPVPPIAEQKLILKKYTTLNKKIFGEVDCVDKLKKQKTGLMHDLLTGKVPVTVEADAAEAAYA